MCTQPILDPNNATGIDDLVNQFQLITTNLLDEFAPVRPITVRERVHNTWFDVDSRDTRRKVRLLERRFKTDKAPATRDAWRSALRGSRKKNHVKAAEYWKAKISAGIDCRSVWRTVNGLLGDVRTDNQPTFTAEDYHNCIDKKTADVRAATASATPRTFSECYTSRLDTYETVDAETMVSLIKAAPSKQCLLDPLTTWLL